MHTDMELWNEIRRRVLVEGASKRSICLEYGLGWRTVDKILAHPEPPGYRQKVPRGQPKLGPYIGEIDAILEADREASPKPRSTDLLRSTQTVGPEGHTGTCNS